MVSSIQIAFCGAWLAAVLALAVASDMRSHRIPNKIVLSGVVVAIALHVLLPAGNSLFDANSPGALGIVQALEGLAAGFALLLPLYLLRAMGAGDVKLMAMVGAFLGPAAVLSAALLTLVAGGILALAVALANRTLLRAMTNARLIVTSGLMRAAGAGALPVEPGAASAGKLPYAVAIAAGTLLHVALSYSGYSL